MRLRLWLQIRRLGSGSRFGSACRSISPSHHTARTRVSAGKQVRAITDQQDELETGADRGYGTGTGQTGETRWRRSRIGQVQRSNLGKRGSQRSDGADNQGSPPPQETHATGGPPHPATPAAADVCAPNNRDRDMIDVAANVIVRDNNGSRVNRSNARARRRKTKQNATCPQSTTCVGSRGCTLRLRSPVSNAS